MRSLIVTLLFMLAGCSHSQLPSRSDLPESQDYFYLRAGLADDYPIENASEEQMRKDFEIIRESGSQFYRVGISWHETEVEPGKYDWSRWDRLFQIADEYKIKLIPYICYTPRWAATEEKKFWSSPPKNLETFAIFAQAIAARYKNRAPSWELWNEPDIADYWRGSAEDFAEMVTKAADAIRKVDSNVKIVLGGMAKPLSDRFFENLLKIKDFQTHFDIFNVHGYFQTWSPQMLEDYPDQFENIHFLLKKYASGKDLWLAEFGFSSRDRTEVEQAQGLWKSHVLAASAEAISLMAWYRIKDLPPNTNVIGDSHNLHLGIINTKGKKKSAFYALKLFNQLFDQPFRVIKISSRRSKKYVIELFQKKDGNYIATAWANDDTEKPILQMPDGTIIKDLPIANDKVWIATISDRKPHQVQTIPLLGGVQKDQSGSTDSGAGPNRWRPVRPILPEDLIESRDEFQRIAQ
jgi:hypothetical protein